MGRMSLQDVPFGMQNPGGLGNRPELVYPDGPFRFPELTEEWETAVCIENGEEYISEAEDVTISGEFSHCRAENISVISDVGNKNAFLVKGNTKYVLEHALLQLSGDGSNDFECIGAGVTAYDGCELVVRNADITTTGLVRCCTAAAKGSILKVYDSKLKANGGVLPEGYDPKPGPGGMLTPPPGLEIGGTARAHLSMDHSHTYFYNTSIEADGWAALSTDASNGYVYLEADNCDLTVRHAGYGIYSDGHCHTVLKNCKVNTATHTSILAGECTARFENTDAHSGKYFMMVHNVMGTTEEIAQAEIIGGHIRAGSEAFLLRSCNTYIDMQGVSVVSEDGVLARAIINPDFCATKVEGKDVFGNHIIMSDMDVAGDVINDDEERTFALTLSGTRLTGALRDIYLQMDESSRWMAVADSVIRMPHMEAEAYLTDRIDAKPGVTIHLLTDSKKEPISRKLNSGGILVIE